LGLKDFYFGNIKEKIFLARIMPTVWNSRLCVGIQLEIFLVCRKIATPYSRLLL